MGSANHGYDIRLEQSFGRPENSLHSWDGNDRKAGGVGRSRQYNQSIPAIGRLVQLGRAQVVLLCTDV